MPRATISDTPPTSTRDAFAVRGGRPITGTLRVNGAKNSALKLMAAGLLADGASTITNVPAIADVPVMGRVLEGLGADVTVEDDRVVVTPRDLHWHAPREHVTRIRASVCVLGPLLARLGRARLALPGGDRIGARQIDLHLRGLSALGARVRAEGDEVEVRAERLRGADITLDYPSVGATENIVMAAVLAEGRTVVDNAAREPEIADLCRMLVAMGADIDGIGSSTLSIVGADELHAARHATMGDRIEAGTFALVAAVTGGDVPLTDVDPGHLRLCLTKLDAMGATVEERDRSVRVAGGGLRAVDVVTLPYPGFPTDLQPMLMVVLSQAMGTSIITENVYESRFSFVDELARLGADVTIDGHHAVIRGPRPLRGTTVRALDVRAGAACVLAGLVADGETTVTDVHHVDRGYADFIPRLRSLGADVERTTAPTFEG